MNRTLVRPTDSRRLAGVCAGLARYTGINVSLLRAAFLVFALFGVGEVVYIVLWLVIPKAEMA